MMMMMMESLPKDLIRYIMLEFWLTPMDVSRMARVSKRFHEICRSPQIWSRLAMRYFGADSTGLLLPEVAMLNLPQKERFRSSHRERALQLGAARFATLQGIKTFEDFKANLIAYRLEVWPARVFYLGPTEVCFANATNGILHDFFRAQCVYEEESYSGRAKGGVAPAAARAGGQMSVYHSVGDSAFNAAAFPRLMHHVMTNRDVERKGGLVVIVEPPCGFGQARPLIAKAVSGEIAGHPYMGTVELTRLLALGLRATLKDWNALPYPFLMVCFEGPECWSGVVGEGGTMMKGTYHGFNPRVRKRRPDLQLAMRKNAALRLMKAEAKGEDDDELRVETPELVAAKRVCQTSSVFDTMFQAVSKNSLLCSGKGIVLLSGAVAGFDEALFLRHCSELSQQRAVTLLHHDRRAISVVVASGACAVATNFEWTPTAL